MGAWVALVKGCRKLPSGASYTQWLSAINTACVTKLGTFALGSTEAGFAGEVDSFCSALDNLRARANAFNQPTSRGRQLHSHNC